MTKPVSPLRQRMIDDMKLRNMSRSTVVSQFDCNSLLGSNCPIAAVIFKFKDISEIVAIDGKPLTHHVGAHRIDLLTVVPEKLDHLFGRFALFVCREFGAWVICCMGGKSGTTGQQ